MHGLLPPCLLGLSRRVKDSSLSLKVLANEMAVFDPKNSS